MNTTDLPAATESRSSSLEDLAALRRLVVECSDLREIERCFGQFNLFDILKVTNNELRHSNVLAWLLDPNGSHGLNALFLRKWLIRVTHDSFSGKAHEIDPVEIDSAFFSSVKVSREWHNIDLLLEIDVHDEKWIVAIENKVWSTQHSSQLARYREILDRYFPKTRQLLILLSVSGEEPEDDAYVIARYDHIAGELKACVKEMEGAIGDGPRLMINHYVEIIETRFMPDSRVEQLARKIYHAHRRALDVIFEHRPDITEILSEKLSELVGKDGAKVGLIFRNYAKGRIWFRPNSWILSPHTDPIVCCEINFYFPDKLVLKAVAGPGDQTWRENLFKLSKVKSFRNITQKATLPKQWYQFYAVQMPNFSTREVSLENADESVLKIWEWCLHQVRSGEFENVKNEVATLLTIYPPLPSKEPAALDDPIT